VFPVVSVTGAAQQNVGLLTKGGVMSNESGNHVVVVDVKMPFMSMVTFMVKWAIASIPAIIILVVIGAITAGVLSGIFGGMGRHY
jgi:hypothetical protein